VYPYSWLQVIAQEHKDLLKKLNEMYYKNQKDNGMLQDSWGSFLKCGFSFLDYSPHFVF